MSDKKPRRFVVLDRDGTIIKDAHYLADPAGVELLPGSLAGLARLAGLGLGLVVISNQSGVGRGYFGPAEVAAVNARVAELLAAGGVAVAGWYYCPHTPEEGCACRKPGPALLLQAAREHGFDPAQAFVVGDKAADVDLGLGAGATAILVLTGHGAEAAETVRQRAARVAPDLAAAAEFIAGCLA
ncbi:MAG: HAD family hydrolase [Deltaproteobacteria bacterium]|nr:HAD family hydrolase [Deltaproteobacteria bacterium]